jgi:hypothetical protein
MSSILVEDIRMSSILVEDFRNYANTKTELLEIYTTEDTSKK